MSQGLNPADHFTLLMDHEIRRSGLSGNYCALVMEVDGLPDPEVIARQCTAFGRRLPLATARLQRHGQRYRWVRQQNNSIPFQATSLSGADGDQAGLRRQALAIVNQSMPVEASPPFALHLLSGNDHSLLLLRWFHPAADAKGAELLLYHLFADSESDAEEAPAPLDLLLQRWGWWQKFRLARAAVSNIRVLDRRHSVLPPGPDAKPATSPTRQRQNLAQTLLRYDTEQTRTILANARAQAGMTGTTLYLIAAMMRAMEAGGASPEGDAYCVPYAANLRRRRALSPIFGNQVSFLFAQAERRLLSSKAELLAHLCRQHKDAVKQGLDYAMLPLMQAGSWLSLEKYGRIVRESPDRRERNSFWFSFTGEMEPAPQDIAGCPVRGMYQISPVTSPPGLGLFASLFRGRLTLSYAYAEAAIDAAWVDRLAHAMTDELLSESANNSGAAQA